MTETEHDVAALEVAVDLIATRLAEVQDPLDRYALARVLGRIERMQGRLLAWHEMCGGTG